MRGGLGFVVLGNGWSVLGTALALYAHDGWNCGIMLPSEMGNLHSYAEH